MCVYVYVYGVVQPSPQSIQGASDFFPVFFNVLSKEHTWDCCFRVGSDSPVHYSCPVVGKGSKFQWWGSVVCVCEILKTP